MSAAGPAEILCTPMHAHPLPESTPSGNPEHADPLDDADADLVARLLTLPAGSYGWGALAATLRGGGRQHRPVNRRSDHQRHPHF